MKLKVTELKIIARSIVAEIRKEAVNHNNKVREKGTKEYNKSKLCKLINKVNKERENTLDSHAIENIINKSFVNKEDLLNTRNYGDNQVIPFVEDVYTELVIANITGKDVEDLIEKIKLKFKNK